MRLMYCAVLANNDVVFTFEDFLEIAENRKLFSDMVCEIEKYNKVLAQFVEEKRSATGQPDGLPAYIQDLAGVLITSGLDARYVMDEMELSDIPVFAKALEKDKRERMEAARLWTFLSVAPHIDTNRVRTPEDYYPFPWEIERQRKEAEEVIARDQEAAERFFQEGMNIFKN